MRTLMHALLVLALGTLGCSAFQTPSSALTSLGKRTIDSGVIGDTAQATARCEPLKTRKVGFDEEHALGGALALNWVARGGGLTGGDATPKPFATPSTQAAQHELNLVGRNLGFQSERPFLPWTFGILESEGQNAISAPGGYVFVTRGMLATLKDEAQLAGVLAHEIAHITLQHAIAEYQKALHQQCTHAAIAEGVSKTASGELNRQMAGLNAVALKLTGTNAKVDFNQVTDQTRAFLTGMTEGLLKTLFDRGYSKDDEFAADLVALHLMANAGYDPEAYIEVLGTLPESKHDKLATAHPKKAERQKRLRAELERARKASEDPNALLPMVTVATSRGPLPKAIARLQKEENGRARQATKDSP